jgi:hypothetical protein
VSRQNILGFLLIYLDRFAKLDCSNLFAAVTLSEALQYTTVFLTLSTWSEFFDLSLHLNDQAC